MAKEKTLIEEIVVALLFIGEWRERVTAFRTKD